MFENPRKGRQARNFTTNAPKILDLKSSSEQIFSRKLPLGAPEGTAFVWLVREKSSCLLWAKCPMCFVDQQQRQQLRKHHLKMNSAASNFIMLIPSPVFPSSTKCEIRHSHVVVKQRRLRNVQKTVMHVQSCCFAKINLLLFCGSHCHRHCFKVMLQGTIRNDDF